MGIRVRSSVLVEDPDRPLLDEAGGVGTARLVSELPERLEIEVQAETAGYLVVADAFDPGWSAAVDGQTATIRPAFVNFRAVYVQPGKRHVVFRYEPAGWKLGGALSLLGLVIAVSFLLCPWPSITLGTGHDGSRWTRWWPGVFAATAILGIVLLSSVNFPTAWLRSGSNAAETRRQVAKPPASSAKSWFSTRWTNSLHRFTWGADLEAIKPRAGSQW